ncbi:unnamed protein product [Spirodela intermedia]|uniref:Translation initiation factor 3 N-terminal domain-containing protein n=1 Tax=Spirodela intermedia TaxID=51605 RepID=A0A7I8IE11_SPIIN|nr:unnamed protein product [Spirodela intermedia]CAA6656016.1 unnamed protein product [Spirodela intermedia]
MAPEEAVSATSRFRDGIQYIAARFFAVPVQGKPKEDLKSMQGPRLNEGITAKFIRLVTDDEALGRARKLDLDLVEVQRTSKPPVCKIMDYHKEKFRKDTMEKERAKTKSESTIRKGDFKEVRLKGKIEQKDIEVKAETIKGLVERGYRVKCMALPSKQRGAEECDLGALLNRLTDLIEDVICVESGPFVEKQQAYVVVRHVKFGSKKGSRKKACKATEGLSGPGKAASAPATALDGAAADSDAGGDLDSDSDVENEVLADARRSITFNSDEKRNVVVSASSENLAAPSKFNKPANGFTRAAMGSERDQMDRRAGAASRSELPVGHDQRYGRGIEANPRSAQGRPVERDGDAGSELKKEFGRSLRAGDSRWSERSRSEPRNIPRQQENLNRQQIDPRGGRSTPPDDSGTPAPSYGIFSNPTRRASGDRRSADLQRDGERNPPSDGRR